MVGKPAAALRTAESTPTQNRLRLGSHMVLQLLPVEVTGYTVEVVV